MYLTPLGLPSVPFADTKEPLEREHFRVRESHRNSSLSLTDYGGHLDLRAIYPSGDIALGLII